MVMRSRKPDVLQGTLDLLILTVLKRGPQHGYGIATEIATLSEESLRVEEGSLYPALHRMEQTGWIAASWRTTENNRRAREYRLTRAGHERLKEASQKWDELTAGVAKVLRFAPR